MQSLNSVSKVSDSFQSDGKLIRLHDTARQPVNRFFLSILGNPLEKLLSIDHLNAVYQKALMNPCHTDFFEQCLQLLDIRYNVSQADLNKIPTQGPVVVVANHPFGGIEGIIVAAMLSGIRDDTMVMGNYLLQQIPQIRDRIIPVDPFGKKESLSSNIRGIKASIKWVKSGGALVTFPAGQVSHFHLGKQRVMDAKWTPHIGSIIRHAQATVVPIFFPGRNSSLFHVAGMVNPRLRTALLCRELINKKGKHIDLYIGKPIPWQRLKACRNDTEIVDYLRAGTYILKYRSHEQKKSFLSVPLRFPANVRSEASPIIDPVDKSLLKSEIKNLPEKQMLVKNRNFYVYYATANQIPQLLNEIGRLRELTFREAEEGTGHAIDLDRFDRDYLHLFLWNEAEAELVGAYRLGLIDEILEKRGKQGLYTQTLFDIRSGFFRQLGDAMEIGRSFICSSYQKKYNSLLLLWQGIGNFIAHHPRYKTLFGPVSICGNYNVISKSLMVRFLEHHKFDNLLSRYVIPRSPYRSAKIKDIDTRFMGALSDDIDTISILISEIEEDGKGVPILLRHYLKLNARLVGFNVDKDFSNVLDGLIVVNLTETSPKLLKRFMGNQEYASFTGYHGLF